jgi:glucose/arabinose dehydrogenase
VFLALPACFALAADLEDVSDALAGSLEHAGDAAVATISDDRPAAVDLVDDAEGDALEALDDLGDASVQATLGKRSSSAARRLEKYVLQLRLSRTELLAPEGTAKSALKIMRKAVKAGRRAGAVLRKGGIAGFALVEKKASRGGIHRAGRSVTFKVIGGSHDDGTPCDESPDFEVEDLVSGEGSSVSNTVEDLGKGRWRVTLGADAGGARITATGCDVTRIAVLANEGPKGELGDETGWGLRSPADLDYDGQPIHWRAGVEGTPVEPTVSGGPLFVFTVAPALPAGLVLDSVTGELSGIATTDSATTTYTVTATNSEGSTEATFDLQVTPALPDQVLHLEDGFMVEEWLGGLEVPVKMAFAADGRLFFNELRTGNIRVVDAGGNLLTTPFATLSVQTGGERGLLGLALHPDFDENGYLYVYATVPADEEKPYRNQVLRFTATGDLGGSPTVLVDDLPAGIIHNAGDLRFGPDGMLYVSTGDTADSDLSQEDGVLAGRILRFDPDGGIPADNPDPVSPEWCRGLRNSFDMTFHPVTERLFASENGPTFGDEINLIQAGKNYEWESLPEDFPGGSIGPRIAEWTPVIAPTGVAWVTQVGLWEGFVNNLLVCAYDTAEVRRMPMSGSQFTDVDDEIVLIRWSDEAGVENKPLDVVQGPAGDLWVSTFDGIWKVTLY